MWITPTTNDVLSEFTASEAATIQNLQGSVSSNLGAILTRVIDKIRDAIIAAGKSTDPNSSTTIPRGLVDDAVAIARWRLLTSAPLLKQFQTDARKDANDKALAKLDAIAAGKYGVEPPAGTSTGTSTIETVQDGNSGNSREDLKGL
jgi:hypothetical protein